MLEEGSSCFASFAAVCEARCTSPVLCWYVAGARTQNLGMGGAVGGSVVVIV